MAIYTPATPFGQARLKLTCIRWDEENAECVQMDFNGHSVTRRLDNNMINGTKLLNVTGMTRGRRDGILKNEKERVVVKAGAMSLKGVWIPFERAVKLARAEGIFEKLMPMFADDPVKYL
ncbi:DNA-binding domain of Mlu1-box binding protein MBP1, partial [Ramicandelaber brevisporus]